MSSIPHSDPISSRLNILMTAGAVWIHEAKEHLKSLKLSNQSLDSDGEGMSAPPAERSRKAREYALHQLQLLLAQYRALDDHHRTSTREDDDDGSRGGKESKENGKAGRKSRELSGDQEEEEEEDEDGDGSEMEDDDEGEDEADSGPEEEGGKTTKVSPVPREGSEMRDDHETGNENTTSPPAEEDISVKQEEEEEETAADAKYVVSRRRMQMLRGRRSKKAREIEQVRARLQALSVLDIRLVRAVEHRIREAKEAVTKVCLFIFFLPPISILSPPSVSS